MSQIDYTCYTVPECSSDDDDDDPDDNDVVHRNGNGNGNGIANGHCNGNGNSNDDDRDESSDGTLENVLQSDCTLDSDATTTSSLEHHIYRKHQQQHQQHHYHNHQRYKRYAPQRVSMPALRAAGSHSRELTPQLGIYHDGPEAAPQWGYFVPLAPNCFFSPPMQRRHFREKENDRSRRAVSYGGGGGNSPTHCATIPRAAPRRVALMKEPPPPPPPKPQLTSKASLQSTDSSHASSIIASKYPQSEYNLIQKIDSNSTLTAPAQYQPQNFYANTGTISSTNGGYSSLLCHASSTASPLAVRKRDKLLHRFSDAATLGRKLKKKKNTNRTCRSMTEAIEMLADPVIEDEFFVS
ncbi:uncharacterized protein LOC108659784 isoform X2 [Drosophila navojoa]|uniref:uncharacterized protein LOC108659784 isoform X2 n=1 Tax=Drosophila navojoa TaxID=7232 RepID=UPI0011BE941A|nr:uncharacterized protein LOC108659784 isoform X2 [Drosophila navojoa]